MKKTYITPEMEINETVVANMMALSLMEGNADSNKPALVEEEASWDIWE